MGGRWEFPGGKAEEGESAEEALVREIQEEFGARISVGTPLCQTWFSNGNREYILTVFEAVLETPILILKEHEEIRWLRWKEIGSMELSDSDREIYERLEF
ncbi:MAG: NUDIX domain-containing protein [Spirochaetaceae bacterium]|nr:NUDIX domain-containing protein [Spirochaetaceae bacterium]